MVSKRTEGSERFFPPSLRLPGPFVSFHKARCMINTLRRRERTTQGLKTHCSSEVFHQNASSGQYPVVIPVLSPAIVFTALTGPHYPPRVVADHSPPIHVPCCICHYFRGAGGHPRDQWRFSRTVPCHWRERHRRFQRPGPLRFLPRYVQYSMRP